VARWGDDDRAELFAGEDAVHELSDGFGDGVEFELVLR
jgi:hypothetical protein